MLEDVRDVCGSRNAAAKPGDAPALRRRNRIRSSWPRFASDKDRRLIRLVTRWGWDRKPGWTSFAVTLSGAEDDARVTRFDGRPRACLRRPSAPRPAGSFVHRRGAQSRTRRLTSSWASSPVPRETLGNLTCPQKMGFLVTGRKPSRQRTSWLSSTGAASQVA